MRFAKHSRSMLATPAIATGRYDVSRRSGADIAMVDLEDSVPEAEKASARAAIGGFFVDRDAAMSRLAVRVNALTTRHGLADLVAVGDLDRAPDVVVVPMVESARDIRIAEEVLAPVAPDLRLMPVIETPVGLLHAAIIAAASSRVEALVFGSADYATASGVDMTWDCLVHARWQLVNAARAAGVEAMDAPTFDMRDGVALRSEALRARELGFSGKVAVHPRQLPVITDVFSPDQRLLQQARRVVGAAQSGSRNIAVVDGSMVGPPFFEASRNLIEAHERFPA